ncbi:MAG TPA: hypothetical protein EYQ50_21075 [Verrucomicrobiales bacterium]|nr:hypothetical protein [Verrucomicrobiales bacterium]HIL70993.1 hypothetical protein [Verrucomicrobiota bacterium]
MINSTAKSDRNSNVWLGPVIVLLAAFSYFTIFVKVPALRDGPWLNLALLIFGLVLSCRGTRQTFTRESGILKKMGAALGFLFSFGLTGLFSSYIFFMSYGLPETTEVTNELSKAPGFSLVRHDGANFTQSDYLGSKLVLVFYRGHW